MAEALYQVTISGPQMAQTIVLPIGSLSIGRQAGNDLVLVHPLVSRRHAKLDSTADACQVTDLGSTHGTTVNRVRLEPETPHTLVAGDVIEHQPPHRLGHVLEYGSTEARYHADDHPIDHVDADGTEVERSGKAEDLAVEFL